MESIILASASPRRRELLSQIGIEYEVVPSNTEEIITSAVPCEIVMELAKQKAEDIVGKINVPSQGITHRTQGVRPEILFIDEQLPQESAEAPGRQVGIVAASPLQGVQFFDAVLDGFTLPGEVIFDPGQTFFEYGSHGPGA